jgi:hypothetical protein
MKWRIALSVFAVLLSVIVIATYTPVAYAEGPSDATLAIVQCSGMNLDTVTSGEQAFDTAIGYQKQLATQAQWEWSYVWRVNQFANRVGCPDVLVAGDSWQGTLTYAAKYYVPTFKAILVFNKFEAQGD